jgi:hypothetical protein
VSARPVQLDFIAQPMRITPVGAAILVVALACAAGVLAQYRVLEARRAGLELKLAAVSRHAAREAAPDPRVALRLTEDAGNVAQELATPWTGLLADLEAASRDSAGQVAVLSIEPDQEKHRVRISAESRDLALALSYVERLKSSHSLRFPMLDSHEVRTDDAERPVRFAMSADWTPPP